MVAGQLIIWGKNENLYLTPYIKSPRCTQTYCEKQTLNTLEKNKEYFYNLRINKDKLHRFLVRI